MLTFAATLFCSLRVFSIAAIMCIFVVLPLNYFGQEVEHTHFRAESLEHFTIDNVKEGSEWYEIYNIYNISRDHCDICAFFILKNPDD